MNLLINNGGDILEITQTTFIPLKYIVNGYNNFEHSNDSLFIQDSECSHEIVKIESLGYLVLNKAIETEKIDIITPHTLIGYCIGKKGCNVHLFEKEIKDRIGGVKKINFKPLVFNQIIVNKEGN